MMNNFLTVSYEDAVKTLTTNRATGSMRALAKSLDMSDFEGVYGQSATLARAKSGGLTISKNFP